MIDYESADGVAVISWNMGARTMNVINDESLTAFAEAVDRALDDEAATGIIAAGGTLGILIPPSIPMVLYAIVSDQSVGFLFAAGMLPGLLMALMMGVMNYIMARRHDFPVDEVVPMRDLPGITWKALPALMLPVILLGGIDASNAGSAREIGASGVAVMSAVWDASDPRSAAAALVATRIDS